MNTRMYGNWQKILHCATVKVNGENKQNISCTFYKKIIILEMYRLKIAKILRNLQKHSRNLIKFSHSTQQKVHNFSPHSHIKTFVTMILKLHCFRII